MSTRLIRNVRLCACAHAVSAFCALCICALKRTLTVCGRLIDRVESRSKGDKYPLKINQ